MRHGTTEWNIKKICQGQADVPLHAIGVEEAHNAIITQHDITDVFYSPLQRTVETTRIVTQHMTCPKREMIDIKARHFGDLEGKPWVISSEELAKTYKTFEPTNGELWLQFSTRVLQGINAGLARSECPLFIAHSEVFRAIVDALDIEYCSINNCDLIKFIPTNTLNNSWKAIHHKKDFE